MKHKVLQRSVHTHTHRTQFIPTGYYFKKLIMFPNIIQLRDVVLNHHWSSVLNDTIIILNLLRSLKFHLHGDQSLGKIEAKILILHKFISMNELSENISTP